LLWRLLNPPEADKGFIPRRLRLYNAFSDTPLLCGGVVHYSLSGNRIPGNLSIYGPAEGFAGHYKDM
jgi:hypothetical protein